MNAIAELAIEAIGIEQRQEKLEIPFLAVVRRRRHQKQVPNMRAQLLGEAESTRLLQLGAEIMCR